MFTQSRNHQLNARRYLDRAMYLTMILSLIVISVYAFLNHKDCVSVKITSKNQVVNKYFYQLSDGSRTWSDQNFAVNESVCISNPPTELAQK